MLGYKVFTHDLRSPIQGGAPVWDGSLPITLPAVEVDDGPENCAAGWNFVEDIPIGLRIAGLWSDGRPSRVFEVQAPEAIARGNKRRARVLTIVRECSDGEIVDAIRALSLPFGAFADDMAAAQVLWREALARPYRDKGKVEEGLAKALAARGLETWELKQFDNVRDAWAARDAWDARAAWDAKWALMIQFASRQNWITYPADLLTVGLRDAYLYGLALAGPVAEQTLGYVMEA